MGVKRLTVLLFLTAQTIQAQTIPQVPVEPSPWWAIERFGQNLVTKTTIDRENKRVILTIDSGVWSNLDYLGRYRLIHTLGSNITESGYSLMLQSQRQNTLATFNQDGQINPPTLGALPLRAKPVLLP
jgi:hypothetical protein